MDRNGTVAVILLLLLIVAVDVSSAAIFSTFRRFVAVASTNSNQVSPSPSPDPIQTGAKTTPDKAIDNSTKVVNSSDSNSGLKDLNNSDNNNTKRAGSPAAENKEENVKKNDELAPKKKNDELAPKKKNDELAPKKENETEPDSQQSEVGGATCSGMLRLCKDDASLVACILDSDPEHKKMVVLVQNEGEGTLKVNISTPNPVGSTVTITKHQSRKINLTVGDSNQVKLKAGNGECVLHTDLPQSQGNTFFNLPSYDRLVTPINGAYFLILTVLIFGGMSICYFFRKKKQQDGIPYQELEMGLSESSLGNNVETAEGWDQGWDDDWDEENAVKSPVVRHAGSLSSNGLTSRSPKREGWENDWDD